MYGRKSRQRQRLSGSSARSAPLRFDALALGQTAFNLSRASTAACSTCRLLISTGMVSAFQLRPRQHMDTHNGSFCFRRDLTCEFLVGYQPSQATHPGAALGPRLTTSVQTVQALNFRTCRPEPETPRTPPTRQTGPVATAHLSSAFLKLELWPGDIHGLRSVQPPDQRAKGAMRLRSLRKSCSKVSTAMNNCSLTDLTVQYRTATRL